MEEFLKSLGLAAVTLKNLFYCNIEIYGLSKQETTTLFYIEHHAKNGELNVKKIQEIFNIKVSSVVQILNKLEEKGLISRQNSTEDKRVTIITLTDKGKDLVNDFKIEHKKRLELIIADKKEEIEKALLTIRNLNENLDSLEKTILTIKESK